MLVTAFVVFIERGQRRITVNYAKRQVGNRIYGGQSSYLPLKINMANVIPPIFASSLILFPATLASWFTSGDSTRWIRDLAASLSPGQSALYIALRCLDRFLCILLHGIGFQSERNCREPQEERCFRSRYSSGRADLSLY